MDDVLDQLDLDDKDVIRFLAVMRIVLGVFSFVAPRKLIRLWTGERPGTAVAVMAVRGMGARDVALGAGAMLALDKGRSVKGWLEAQATADAGDAASTLMQGRDIPRIRKAGLLALEIGAAWVGWQLAQRAE